jgi:predicted ribosomally synthesized peptide with SipW-like signal peptide
MLVLTLATALVVGTTLAIFTDEAENVGNVFTAGTVDITAGETTLLPVALAANMAPGDTVTGSFVVTNVGTLELRFDVSMDATGVLFEEVDPGDTPAEVTLDAYYQDVVLGPEDEATVEFSVHLPITADNSYQGTTGTVNFTIEAEQTANNP